ncbi:cadherin-1-like [Clarias gariepinus]|uniref:cadherin-1-like n=1 Tax=Clarias gariepinus TaxID=13013 RepID=UPI00234C8FBD|nr:cadherin-1-like [Clarias gariepinus]
MEVIVQVLDQNDNSPVFTQNAFHGSVREAAKIGVEFMTITATDADDPDTDNADVRYSIISQTPPEPKPNMFAINPVSGAIRVNADGLDRAKYPEYNLEIQAADQKGEGRAAKGKAIITVTDNNDESSTKVNWVIPPISLMENDAKGPFPKQVVQIKSIQAKETPMVYSITGEGADLPPVGLFTIARNTGWLSVSRPLDREVKAKYVVVVRAHSPTDPSVKEDPIEVIVQVLDQNDNSPVFTQNPFLGSVPETAKIGVEFMTITATDADDPDTDNADVRYSIISQTPPEPKPNMFAINPVSGAIRVNADGLDRAKYPEYNLEIQAADQKGEGRAAKGKAIITVTDNNDKSSVNWVIPPISLMENDAKGPFPKQVVQIKSIQAKETPMVYSITGEGADLPPVGLFTIARNTGWLSVSRPLDREVKAKYVLVAHAYSPTDPSIKEDPIEVIVQVLDQNDNSPVFTQNPFLGRVSKTEKIGVEFMTITATDADDPDTDNAAVSYSIISQTPPEPKPNMFAINPVSGAIRVNADGLDRAKYPEYNLEIQAADQKGEGRAAKGKAIITVTDNNDESSTKVNWVIPPISLMENDAKGPFPKQVVQIKSIQAKETPMVYSITGEGADLPPVGLFTIARNTGWLSVSRPLDREVKAKYALLVHAYSPTDPSIKEDPIEVIVQVLDQNDNSPVFTQNPFLGRVSKTEKIGVEFMTITATDADDPDTDNADVSYSIISQTPPEPKPNMFAINPVSGAIRVNADGLDRAKYPEYNLEIQAADQAGEGRAAKGKAIITVTDNNDN